MTRAGCSLVRVEQREAFFQALNRGIGEFFERFAAIVDFRFLEDSETSPGWDQVAKDHVFLQTDQPVDLASQRRFGQHLGGFLERRRTDKAVGLHGCFGDPEQLRASGRALRLLALRRRATERFNLSIGLLEGFLGNDGSGTVVAVTRIGDLLRDRFPCLPMKVLCYSLNIEHGDYCFQC